MLKRLFKLFSSDVAVDLGTANTAIYVAKRGIVLQQPTVVAIRQNSETGGRSIAAVGHDAKDMLGRTPVGLNAIRPLKDGVIADLEMTEVLLQYFLRQANIKTKIKTNMRVLVSVPAKATLLEHRAVREAVDGAGANEIRLIQQAMAAAIGAGDGIPVIVVEMEEHARVAKGTAAAIARYYRVGYFHGLKHAELLISKNKLRTAYRL